MRRASASVISLAGSSTGFDDFLHREELDRAGLLVQLGDVVLVGAEVLPRGDQHGVLDRVQHDLRVDAFFLAQNLDGLKDRFQSVPRFVVAWLLMRSGGSYHSNFRLAFSTWSKRKLDGFAGRGFQTDQAVRDTPASVPSQWR